MNIDILKLIEYPKSGVISKQVFKDRTGYATLFCMAKGTDIGKHTSTKKGFVYVIEGQGIFNLKGKKIKMTPGILISMENNAIHSLKATKNTSFMLYLN